MFLLAGLAHHGEPGDPELLVWIRDQIDTVLGLGAAGMVIAFGAVIVMVPLAIMTVFVIQRVRRGRA